MKRGDLSSPIYQDEDYYGFFLRDCRGKRVLDLGSSVGSFEKSTRFAQAWQALKESDLVVTADIDFHAGIDLIADAHRLPFEDDCFDVVIANNLIEHLRDPVKALAEMRRIMVPGGRLLFTVPFLYPVHEAPNDYFRPTRFGLEVLLKDFDSVVIKERGQFFSVLARYIWLMFRPFRLGRIGEFVVYPFLWFMVRLDRLDRSKAFALTLFGEASKPPRQ